MDEKAMHDQDVLDDVVRRMGVEDAETLLGCDVFTIRGRNAFHTALSRAKEAEPGQQSLVLGDRRTLQGEVDAGLLKLMVYVCPDCGLRIGEQVVQNRSWPPRCFECNGVDVAEQSLMDGKPMIPLEIPVRKLPAAFKHLDTPKPITERVLAGLAREIDQQRQVSIPAAHAGGFVHNARIILRFAAERAGSDLDSGAIRVHGEGQHARVTFYVDAGEGVGVA